MLSHSVQHEHIFNQREIITQGEPGFKFYIIKNGKVDIYIDKKKIRTLNEYEYFGERALFFKENRSSTAIANGDVDLYSLDHNIFTNLIIKG